MSDNITVTPGSGAIIAAESIGGALLQRIKLSIGVLDTDGGDVSSTNPMPVILSAGSATIGAISNTSFAATQSGTWNITNISGTVSLPTGAATSALQTTGNSSLASIAAGTPAALGQTTSANSMPVVIASDQSSIYVTANFFTYKHITGATTTTVKSSAGKLSNIVFGTLPTTMIIYDNTAASGTVISSMTAIGGAEVPKMITFNLNFNTGLTIVTTGGAADVTVMYQ